MSDWTLFPGLSLWRSSFVNVVGMLAWLALFSVLVLQVLVVIGVAGVVAGFVQHSVAAVAHAPVVAALSGLLIGLAVAAFWLMVLLVVIEFVQVVAVPRHGV